MRILPAFDILGTPLVAGALAAWTLAETARPLRARYGARRFRWMKNAAFGALGAALVRGAIVPAVDRFARWASKRNVGVLRWLPMPAPVRAAAGFLALDYTMYLWHRALHHMGVLWRFHSVHHRDVDLDASTALRFHVAELAASLPFRCAQVVVLGVSTRVALTYEVAMQMGAIFHHSNTRLPTRLERRLGWIIVSPRMHGIHHSLETRELNANWSVIFSLWDRLHGTHRWSDAEPRIGLAPENDPR